jgi:hypothetical protein
LLLGWKNIVVFHIGERPNKAGSYTLFDTDHAGAPAVVYRNRRKAPRGRDTPFSISAFLVASAQRASASAVRVVLRGCGGSGLTCKRRIRSVIRGVKAPCQGRNSKGLRRKTENYGESGAAAREAQEQRAGAGVAVGGTGARRRSAPLTIRKSWRGKDLHEKGKIFMHDAGYS